MLSQYQYKGYRDRSTSRKGEEYQRCIPVSLVSPKKHRKAKRRLTDMDAERETITVCAVCSETGKELMSGA